MARPTKIAAYALNMVAFALGAWIAATALEPAEASPGGALLAEAAEDAARAPTTVDYGPHLTLR
jgi:hypothetical protein